MKKQGLIYAVMAFVWLNAMIFMVVGGFPFRKVDGAVYLTTGQNVYVTDWYVTFFLVAINIVMSVVVYFSVSRKWTAA